MQLDKDFLLNESKTFCLSPWIHMHVWPNGRAFPCCLADPSKPDYGNTNINTLKELWNSETARRLRKNMLNNKASPECTRCYRLESDGDAHTLRKNMNYKYRHHYDKVLTTKEDGYHEEMNFTYMDFRFSNLCNMSCRSCSPTFSTQWYDDFVKRFGSVPKDLAERKFIQLKNKKGFEDELWPYLDTVEEVYWAGGEPMITDTHWKIMNYWVETGHAENISILYTTNFSQLEYKRQNILDLWPKFKNVTVSASLDAMGPHAEFIRKGTVWSDIEANRRLMIERTPDIEFDICPTVSLMNVLHLPDFIEDWTRKGLIKPGNVRINNLLDPDYFCTQILPTEYKQRVTKRWKELLVWVASLNNFDDSKWPGSEFLTACNGLIRFMNKELPEEDCVKHLKQTKLEFDGWDQVRNEKWHEAIPELQDVLIAPRLWQDI